MSAAPKLLALALAALLCACSTPGSRISPLMKNLGPNAHTPVPLYGQAVVVFIRANEDNSFTQSTVYEIQSDGDHFVGVVSGSSKVAYMTQAGRRLFMIVGESADFMEAELAEGKTYYVLVDPRVGWFKSRFSLLPVRKAQIGSPEFQKQEAVDLLVWGPNVADWVRDNVNSIVEKRNQYLPDFYRQNNSQRRNAGLRFEDGYP